MDAIEIIRKKFQAVLPALTERGRRLWVGAEADALGRGGVARVARATGMAMSTVRKGRDEVRRGAVDMGGRERRPGGGRQALEKKDPGLVQMLERLVHPSTRGDPESPLRWTCKSTQLLARELTAAKHKVSPTKVRRLLRAQGFSLQGTSKTKEGKHHPARDEQFAFINERAQGFLERGVPVISVDAKKREAIGEHGRAGTEWQPKGKPVEVMTHDYFDASLAPKVVPYGVYDIGKNLGFVNVGTDHNTPTFAVRSIEKWWDQMGAKRYPSAKELFITADAGGSNGMRSRVWKTGLQELADRTGLSIHVSHFPPGTSKWNKIEHRLFSFITLNWRGRPLATYETVVELIAATTTTKGLKVEATLDTAKYPVGVAVRREAMHELCLEPARFRSEWNYTLRPRTVEQLAKKREPRRTTKVVTHAERRERWRKLIYAQQRSGLSEVAFCRKHGLVHEAFKFARIRMYGLIGRPRRAPK